MAGRLVTFVGGPLDGHRRMVAVQIISRGFYRCEKYEPPTVGVFRSLRDPSAVVGPIELVSYRLEPIWPIRDGDPLIIFVLEGMTNAEAFARLLANYRPKDFS